MAFPINTKSEGRILVPWEQTQYTNITHAPVSTSADWRGDSNVWEAFRRTCPPASAARRLLSAQRAPPPAASHGDLLAPARPPIAPGSEFAFARAPHARFDFCAAPWARYTQGHFFSDWRTLPALYPVFSPARGKGFGDVRIPSHYYYGSTPRYTYGWDAVNMDVKSVDGNEVPWEEKSDKVFWRGATTGGGSTPAGFTHQYHRHR